MKGYKDLSEIRKACRKVTSSATGSDSFMYKCFPFLAEKLERMVEDVRILKIATRTNNKVMRELIEEVRKIYENET